MNIENIKYILNKNICFEGHSLIDFEAKINFNVYPSVSEYLGHVNTYTEI